eukprot:190118_1
MIKTCKMKKAMYWKSVKSTSIINDFQFVSFLIVSEIENLLIIFFIKYMGTSMPTDVSKRISCLMMQVASIKYWNKYHMKFFLKQYQAKLKLFTTFWIKLHMKLKLQKK